MLILPKRDVVVNNLVTNYPRIRKLELTLLNKLCLEITSSFNDPILPQERLSVTKISIATKRKSTEFSLQS